MRPTRVCIGERISNLKLTEYLAIYAAALSTFVFLWNVLQSKAKVKVDLVYGIEGEVTVLNLVYIFLFGTFPLIKFIYQT